MKKLCVHGIMLLLLGHFAVGEVGYAQDGESSATNLGPVSRPIEQANPEILGRRAPRVATKLTDTAMRQQEESGFKWPTFPKPKLPSLPKMSMPKWSLPSTTATREMSKEKPRPSNEPSTWEKFSAGTKNAFTKTKQTLMPWSHEETASTTRKPVQPQRRPPQKMASRTKAKSASSEKKPLFPWFSKKEEEPVKTVNDFLAQPRIQ